MKNAILGIIIDISLRHSENDTSDIRLVDLVKRDLISFIRTLQADDEIYIYEADCVEIAKNRRGKQVSQVNSYEPIYIDSINALKQTLYVVACEDMDAFRCVVYITDNTSAMLKNRFNKIKKLNDINYLDCEFALISLGGEDLAGISGEINTFQQKDSIIDSLKELLENGRYGKNENSCGTAHEDEEF